MRRQHAKTVEELLREDERLVVLLGDIGVYGFRKAFEAYPERVYNIGILEQATIGLAAGLAKVGFIPTVHTIAPFLVERSLEQLKVDFCYQRLGGNFVSVGGSYDYAGLGCTHHCPGDVGLLLQLPGMEIVLPGTPSEFDRLYREAYADGHPTYFRLSERSNTVGQPVRFGCAEVIKEGSKATILAVGPTLDLVLEAARDYDVTVLYYTTLRPFDVTTLRDHFSPRLMLCEPYYAGGLLPDVQAALRPHPITVDCVGVPRAFLNHYGSAEDHDAALGLAVPSLKERIGRLIDE